jgi:hypothetical protein
VHISAWRNSAKAAFQRCRFYRLFSRLTNGAEVPADFTSAVRIQPQSLSEQKIFRASKKKVNYALKSRDRVQYLPLRGRASMSTGRTATRPSKQSAMTDDRQCISATDR